MQYRNFVKPAEDSAPPPLYKPGRDREWVVVAYVNRQRKSLGVFRAQSSEAAVGLARRRHPHLEATFQAELARGHVPRRPSSS
jgi:hypothetical protein